jgi:autotransporter-associated beta strand protein
MQPNPRIHLSLARVIIFAAAALFGASDSGRGAVEQDLLVAYTAAYASSVGGTDNVDVLIQNAVTSSNAINDRSGTGEHMRVAAAYQSATDNTNLSTLSGYIGWMEAGSSGSNWANVSDIMSKATEVGADLVCYICGASSDGAAGVAEQPGYYSAIQPANFWSVILAHETGGHNFGRSHSDGILGGHKTVMLNNYCGGGPASPYFYTNPQVWYNGTQLLGNGATTCPAAGTPAVNGGDNSDPTADNALGVAQRRERVVSGPNLSNVVYDWQFTNAAGSAPANTTVTDLVSGTATATVQGTGATFTGSALRIPGGASGSGAAYLKLPSGIVSSGTAVTIEIWATPLSAQNYGRIMDFNNGSSNYITLIAAVGTNLNTQRFEYKSSLSGTTVTMDSGLATTAGVQHHYAVTFAPSASGTSGYWAWYRDGDLITYLATPNALSSLQDVNNWLGRSAYSGDAFANLDYSEIRISNVALSAGQIQANYRLGPNFAQTATATMSATDASGASSFNAAGQWSNSAAPSSANTYETYDYVLRTPARSTSYTFAGSSLSISGGKLLYKSTGGSTITVNNLKLKGGTIYHAGSGTFTLNGNIAVANDGATIVAAYGPITLNAPLSGSGPVTYYGASSTTLNGSDSAFTGKTIVGNGYYGNITINSEARLGPNPSSLTADQLQFNRGTLYTTTTMSLDDPNRGLYFDVSGGTFNVAAGTTLTLGCPLSSVNLGSGIIAGSIGKANSGTLVLSSTSSSFNGTLYVDTGGVGNDGIVRVANNQVLASAHSPIYIQNNNAGSSTLQLDGSAGNIALSQRVQAAGRSGTIPQVEGLSGTNSIGGFLVAAGGANYILQSDSGLLTVTGPIYSVVTGTRTITFQGSGDLATTYTMSNLSADAVNIVKAGPGTMTVSGAGTYTGSTTINGGTYKLNGTLNPTTSSSSTLTAAAGTTFSGTGTTNVAVTISGTHAPGNPAGTQTFTGPLAYNAASHLQWTLLTNTNSANSASKVAAGTVAVTSGATVDLVLNATGSTVDFTNSFWKQSQSWAVVSGTALSGTFSLGNVSADSGAHAASDYGAFSLQQSGAAVALAFTPYSSQQLWQRANFGANWTNSAIAGDTADPDGDGMTNLLEYALGSDPNTPNPALTPQVAAIGGKLKITFTRNTAATDVTMSVLATDDLKNGPWTELARSTGGVSFTTITNGASVNESGTGATRTVQIGDIYTTSDPAHPKRFLKLQVQH